MNLRYVALASAMGLMAVSSQSKADYVDFRVPFAQPTAVFDKCFVGARVRFNSQASLARTGRTVLTETPSTWSSQRLAPVYFSTQRVVKPQYVYLVPAGSACPL